VSAPYEYSSAGTPSAPAAAPVARGRGLVLAGIVAMVAGAVLGIASFVFLVASIVSTFNEQVDASVVQFPGTASVQLHEGRYAIWVQEPQAFQIDPSQFEVTGPDGAPVPLSRSGDGESYTMLDGSAFAAVAAFQATQAGTYHVDATAVGGDTTGSFSVAPTFVSAVIDHGWWALGIGSGGLLFVLGLILLVVGLVQRHRAREALAAPVPAVPYQAGSYEYATPTPPAPMPPAPMPPPPPPTGPPPGWYADPGRPGGQRYWDGTRWTDYTA
jgi:Protein of unknown function (DUF2510)